MLLVVVEDLLHGNDTRVLITLIRLPSRLLVPIEDTTNEWRNKSNARLSACNSLPEAEQESKIAVDALLLELARGLDTLPCRGDLDQDTLLLDTKSLVQGEELFCLCLGALLVEGQTGIDFGGNTAGDDL